MPAFLSQAYSTLMSCCRVLTCFHFDAAGLKSKSEVWEELASREPGQARRRRGSLRQYFSSPGVCYISYYQKIIKIERKLQCLCGLRENILYSNNFFHAKMKLLRIEKEFVLVASHPNFR